MYDLAHIALWKPNNLYDLASVLHRSCTAPQNGSRRSRYLLIDDVSVDHLDAISVDDLDDLSADDLLRGTLVNRT